MMTRSRFAQVAAVSTILLMLDGRLKSIAETTDWSICWDGYLCIPPEFRDQPPTFVQIGTCPIDPVANGCLIGQVPKR